MGCALSSDLQILYVELETYYSLKLVVQILALFEIRPFTLLKSGLEAEQIPITVGT